MLIVPDIDHLVLRLIACRCYRHNVQTSGYGLSIMASVIPANSLPSLAKCLLLVDPFNGSTGHVIDPDRDMGYGARVKEIVVCAKTVAFGVKTIVGRSMNLASNWPNPALESYPLHPESRVYCPRDKTVDVMVCRSK